MASLPFSAANSLAPAPAGAAKACKGVVAKSSGDNAMRSSDMQEISSTLPPSSREPQGAAMVPQPFCKRDLLEGWVRVSARCSAQSAPGVLIPRPWVDRPYGEEEITLCEWIW